MSERRPGTAEAEPVVNRRRVLAALGVAAASGLAGCGGSGDGGGGGAETTGRNPIGDTPSGGTGNAGGGDASTPGSSRPVQTTESRDDTPDFGSGDDLVCTDLTGSYVSLDPGERRLIFRTEIPQAYQAAGQVRYTNNGSTAEPTTGPMGLGATMLIDQGLQSDPTPFPERDGYELLAETTFNGETRLAAVDTGESTPRMGIAVNGAMLLSGTYGGEERLFAIAIEHQALRPEETDTETCRSALREAMAHTFASMEPNPNTTVAEML